MKKVLVVDDAKSIRTLLAKCLELNGFEVTMAENGKEAIDLLVKEQFDLVFLDIKLPIISGTEVLKRIREKGIMVSVVAVTAFGNIKNAIDCTRLGVVAYIQKPFTAHRIDSLLEELNINNNSEKQVYMDNVNILIKSEKFEEVFNILKNVLPDNPLDAQIYHMLAETCVKLNRHEEAAQYQKLYEAIK